MWKNIWYVLLVAGIFYLAVLYESKGLLAVCIAAVLLPLLFLCVLSYVKQRLNIELLFYSYPVEHTGDYLVGLRIENPSGIYLPHVRARIQVKNMLTGKKQWVKAKGKIPADGMAELTGRIREPEFGMWQARCRQVRCYEWTNFLYLRPKIREEKQVMVFPAAYETNIQIGIRTRLFWSDGELYHPQLNGDDPSETLKLREYQKGDRMNRIHWKLSAKNEELIVAELGMPVGCNVIFFLDGEPAAMGKKESRVYWEVLHSISQEMLRQECAHYIVWRDRKYEEMLCRKAIRKVEDLMDFWCEISSGRMEKGADKEAYTKNFPGEAYASYLVWNQNLDLVCNGRTVIQIKPEQVREQMEQLELLL